MSGEIEIDIFAALRKCYPLRGIDDLSDEEVGFAIACEAEARGHRPEVALAVLGNECRRAVYSLDLPVR